MGVLTLHSGTEISCDGVSAGRQYDSYLHIHTDALNLPEAARVFSNQSETERITYEDENGKTEHEGYTVLLGVEIDPLIIRDGEILVRLRRPDE